MFLDQSQFGVLVENLVGLVISQAYNSYGSSLCLELGKLKMSPHNQRRGEAYIRLDWDWRLESDHIVACGSSNRRPKIAKFAEQLVGLKIEGINIYCAPLEIEIYLSNGQRIRSMAMVTGDPRWNIKLHNGNYLSCEEGKLKISDGSEAKAMSPAAREYREWTEITAKRWERWECSDVKPVGSQCDECRYHLRIDAGFPLFDFGVCSFSGGPFDGRVTSVQSGCPKFDAL
jgi:hypothetical protein